MALAISGGSSSKRCLLSAYEVILGPAAQRAVLGLHDKLEMTGLAESLRHELATEPSVSHQYEFKTSGHTYTATPLSFAGYTAVHRPLSGAELTRLYKEQGRNVAEQGFYVLDILGANSESAADAPSHTEI